MADRYRAGMDKSTGVIQPHLLAFADELSEAQRQQLLDQIRQVDFELVDRLYRQAQAEQGTIDLEDIEPIRVIGPSTSPDRIDQANSARDLGLRAIAEGKVALVLVAGGQGTRLGSDLPKGMYPIGPVRSSSLFQLFAETIAGWRRVTGARIPWYIMTSDATHAETVAYFDRHARFGLPQEDVLFFPQGTMPAVDAKTGKLLMASKSELVRSPNGHGGALLAMRDEGILDDMARRGIESVHYFQVDNPLVKILDPVFIGHHLQTGAEFSTKVVRKSHAEEKMGVVTSQKGRAVLIEYLDLPTEWKHRRGEDDELLFWAGSIAVHAFQCSFLERIVGGETQLPFHVARKKVPFINERGELVTPDRENALKFEMFIFDAMPMAQRVTVVESLRHEEFAPVKNADGSDSPATARAALVARAAAWLEESGIQVERHPDGSPAVPVEIHPALAPTRDHFREWASQHRSHWRGKQIRQATFVEEGLALD